MKGIKNILKASGLIIILIMLAITMIIPSAATPQSYYYKYNFKGAVGLPGTNIILFVLDEYSDATDEKTGNSIYAYCADQSVSMVAGVKYRISGKASDNLRAILKNSSPNVTRANLTNNINNSWVADAFGTINGTISSERAVTGTQYAIWHYTNDFNDSISDEDVNRLYQYLIALPGEEETDYEPIDIDISVKSYWFDSEKNLTVQFTYSNDFDTISLSKNFEGAVIDYQNREGTIFIPSSSLSFDENIEFSITVSTVSYVNDAYILTVSEEEAPSQNLVAFADENIETSASAAVSITPPKKPGKSFSGETAWAYGGEDAIEFFDINTGNNKWGWTNGPLSEGKYIFDLYAGAAKCDLKKGTLVGKLYVEYLNGKVSVSYQMLYGYEATESHLFIGNDYLPKDKKGNYTNAPGQLTHEYNEEYSFDGDIYIAAHLSVKTKK